MATDKESYLQSFLKERRSVIQKLPVEEASLKLHLENENSTLNNINLPGRILSIQEQLLTLKKWIINSLDIYRFELFESYYPVMIYAALEALRLNESKTCNCYSFLVHTIIEDNHEALSDKLGDELVAFACMNDASQIRDNHTASYLLANKYTVSVSSPIFSLFINFIEDNNLHILLKIINQCINYRGMRSFFSSYKQQKFLL